MDLEAGELRIAHALFKGQEALRSYYPAGNPDGAMRVWYEGPKGQERMVRSRDANGQMHVGDGSAVPPVLLARHY